ncbi:hypothetical protein HN415_07405 [Candidatus Woesearchaeota archaeon]|nr:hypothetical protein [Candidatus Woesearchaeota archaeon]
MVSKKINNNPYKKIKIVIKYFTYIIIFLLIIGLIRTNKPQLYLNDKYYWNYKMAENHMMNNNLNKILFHINEAISINPDIIIAHKLKAQIYIVLNNKKQAIKEINKINELKYYSRYHELMGYLYLNENNFNKSLYHYNQSLKIKQINFNSLMGISVLYLKNNELNKSLMYVNKANEILNIWIEKQNEELNLSNKFLRKSYNKNLKDCGLIQIHTIKYFIYKSNNNEKMMKEENKYLRYNKKMFNGIKTRYNL